MKAIIFILILGIVLNASTPVYDIYYNLGYNLQQNLQTETNFLFRTPTNPGDKMDFVFTFPKSYVDTFNFFLSVCQCTIWPSNEEMREMTFNDDTYCHKFTRYTDYYDDDNYHYYYFTYPINGYTYVQFFIQIINHILTFTLKLMLQLINIVILKNSNIIKIIILIHQYSIIQKQVKFLQITKSI